MPIWVFALVIRSEELGKKCVVSRIKREIQSEPDKISEAGYVVDLHN